MATLEELINKGFSKTDKANVVVDRELARLYRDAYNDAIKQIGVFFAKLDGKINLQEARKYQRLDSLTTELAKEYKAITGEAIAISGDTSKANFRDAYNLLFKSLEGARLDGESIDIDKLGSTFTNIPTGSVTASLMSEVSGLNYIKTFQKNMDGQLWELQSTLTRAMATGQPYRKTADQIKSLFNRGYSDALRVVRQEAGRNFSEGFELAFNRSVEAGIELKKRWNATLDGRTRPAHADANGQYADKDGNFNVGGAIGPGPHRLDVLAMNINCRCILTAELVDIPTELTKKA